jgi:spore coat protein A
MKRILVFSVMIIGFLSLGSQSSQTFEPFVDEIKAPPRLIVSKNQKDITIILSQFHTQIHRDFSAGLNEWGYNNSSPGPTIEVESGQSVRIHWKDELPTTHLFAKPRDIDMAMPNMSKWTSAQMDEFMKLHSMSTEPMPDVRNVTHLHGAVVTEYQPLDKTKDNDGWPDNYIVPGQEQVAEYGNNQSSRILWYHDHAIGETGRNVASGLIGMYLIHDKYERSLNLPTGDFDIPLIIEPRGVLGDGTLYYSSTIFKEYYGNSFFVNGKLYPFMNVEPRKYRFRVLNSSNARTVALKLFDMADQSISGPAFYQIGSEAGFLQNTVVLNDPGLPDENRLTLAPAERADIIIDFSKSAGHSFLLNNNARPDDPDASMPLPKVMMFKVLEKVSTPDTSVIPMVMKTIKRIDPKQAVVTRQIVFGTPTPDSNMVQLNGKAWMDPIEERPKLGATEIWELIDTLRDTHPFHIHLVNFQVLDRRPFDTDDYLKTGRVTYTGPAESPHPNEMGWKETVRVERAMVTRIIMQFKPFTGYYVYHCHILEHEDMDMMRPFEVVPAK